MPKYYENTTIFNFTWDQVTQAFWNKYPNPQRQAASVICFVKKIKHVISFSTHVLSEDTFHRYVKQGKLFSKRVLTKTNSSVPKWAERFVPNRPICIVEESIVDPKKKLFITYTRNVGHTKIMVNSLPLLEISLLSNIVFQSVTEKVVYCESEESPGCTVAVRSAWIDSQVKGFGRAICAFGMDRFRKNCTKMVKN